MPSKIVYLKCKPLQVHEALNTEAAQEQLGYSKRSLGSYFANSLSTKKGTGLTEEEIKFLLPLIMPVRAEDPTFKKDVDLFYTDITTLIPYKDGLKMEIGLELDNDKPCTYREETGEKDDNGKPLYRYNTPIEPETYIRYRHAVGSRDGKIPGHPHCGVSPEAAKGNQLLKYYLEDPEAVKQGRLAAAQAADNAISTYQQLKDDAQKIRMIAVLGKNELKKAKGEILVLHTMNDDHLKLKVRELATEKPEIFLQIANDGNLKKRYWLAEFVRVGLINRSGMGVHVLKETSDPLGSTEEESIDTLWNNAANSQVLASIKAKYDSLKA